MKTVEPLLYPFWVWIILGVVAVALTLFTIWAILRITKMRIKKIGNVEFGNEDSGNMNLVYIISRIVDGSSTIQNIKSREIPSAQMMKAEEILLGFKNSILVTFARGISEKSDGVNSVHHPDYLNFRNVLYDCLGGLKTIIRSACLRNGFTHLSDLEYRGYTTRKIQDAKDYFERNIRENYIGGLIETAQEALDLKVSKDSGLSLTELLDEKLVIIFSLIISVAKEGEEEIAKIHETIKDLYEQGTGVPRL